MASSCIPGVGVFIGIICGILFASGAASAAVLLKTKSQMFATLTKSFGVSFLNLLMVIATRSNVCRYDFKDHALMVLRAILSVVCQLTFFFAISKASLSNALTILATQSFFTASLGFCVLKEKVKFVHFIQLILCFVGVILCIRPDFLFHSSANNWRSTFGDLLALVSALSYASMVVLMKKFNNFDVYTFGFVKYGYATILSLTYYLSFCEIEVSVSLKEFSAAFFNSFFNFLTVVVMIFGLQKDKAAMVSMGVTSEIVVSIIIDVTFFHVELNYISAIGSFVIMLSIIVPTLLQMKIDSEKRDVI